MRALRAVAYLTNALQVRSLVPGEEVCRRASSGLILEVDVGEPLPVAVADDEADARFPPSTVSRQSLPVTPEVAPVALGSETLEGVRD